MDSYNSQEHGSSTSPDELSTTKSGLNFVPCKPRHQLPYMHPQLSSIPVKTAFVGAAHQAPMTPTHAVSYYEQTSGPLESKQPPIRMPGYSPCYPQSPGTSTHDLKANAEAKTTSYVDGQDYKGYSSVSQSGKEVQSPKLGTMRSNPALNTQPVYKGNSVLISNPSMQPVMASMVTTAPTSASGVVVAPQAGHLVSTIGSSTAHHHGMYVTPSSPMAAKTTSQYAYSPVSKPPSSVSASIPAAQSPLQNKHTSSMKQLPQNIPCPQSPMAAKPVVPSSVPSNIPPPKLTAQTNPQGSPNLLKTVPKAAAHSNVVGKPAVPAAPQAHYVYPQEDPGSPLLQNPLILPSLAKTQEVRQYADVKYMGSPKSQTSTTVGGGSPKAALVPVPASPSSPQINFPAAIKNAKDKNNGEILEMLTKIWAGVENIGVATSKVETPVAKSEEKKQLDKSVFALIATADKSTMAVDSEKDLQLYELMETVKLLNSPKKQPEAAMVLTASQSLGRSSVGVGTADDEEELGPRRKRRSAILDAPIHKVIGIQTMPLPPPLPPKEIPNGNVSRDDVLKLFESLSDLTHRSVIEALQSVISNTEVKTKYAPKLEDITPLVEVGLH
eukprot:Platyproteum_vivax@DN3232_c0_g1_i1.p1